MMNILPIFIALFGTAVSVTNGENVTSADNGQNHTWHSISLEDLAFRDEKVLRVTSPTFPSGYAINRPGTPSANSNNDRTAIVNNNNRPHDSSKDHISETDLYLLGAIEKMVYRMDLMDQRLRRVEELIQHVIEGSNIKRQDPCPGNFTRVARNCYHFSERQYNWKSATSMCKSLGGNLVELESKEEYFEMISFVSGESYLRGHDYWTGGINPGLLWIWSNSARPVVPKESTKPEDNIIGTGRCLKLSFTGATKIYSYAGIDCSIRLKFICEHEENTTERALKRIHKALKLNN